MKKVLILMMLLALNSCIQKPDIQPVGTVAYSFSTAQDMTKLFGFTATYINQSGVPIQEKIHILPWTKQVAVRVPFDAKMTVEFQAKENIPMQEVYEVGFQGDILGKMHGSKAIKKDALRFLVKLPQGVSADNVNLSIAPLKYNKHFAFTFTIDDAMVHAWSRIFPAIHKKWIDDADIFHLGSTPSTGYTPKYSLSIGDGCGNERRFGVGVAITPTFRNSFNNFQPRMQDRSHSSSYITWEELDLMTDFGGAVYYHNVDETKYNKDISSEIIQGLEDDYNKVVEKLGVYPKVLALPDGNAAYLTAGRNFDKIKMIRSSLSDQLIYLKDCNGLQGVETYGGLRTDNIQAKMNELAEQAASANPYWVGLTVHTPGADYIEMLTKIYELYGRSGADNIWVASWDEVYEYQQLRAGATIYKTINEQEVIFEVSLPEHSTFNFRDLTFLITGIHENYSVTPLSTNINGLHYAQQNNHQVLVNVNFNPELPKLAEKYTTRYEMSRTLSDKEDAEYMVSMLLPELARPFKARINAIDSPFILSKIQINDGTGTVYTPEVQITPTVLGSPTFYRIGETDNLSSSSWKPYTTKIPYTLTSGYGTKKICFQIGDGTHESEVVTGMVNYTDVPISGRIPKEAVKIYQTKYDGYKIVVESKVLEDK